MAQARGDKLHAQLYSYGPSFMRNSPLQLQAVIVDLDGTMVDTLGDFEAALNRALADLDLPPVTRALVARTFTDASRISGGEGGHV